MHSDLVLRLMYRGAYVSVTYRGCYSTKLALDSGNQQAAKNCLETFCWALLPGCMSFGRALPNEGC